MNKKTKLVLELLKPKAKSLGFTKEELEGVASKIADNLGLDDDASDEQLTAAATKEVDAAIFHLELAQSHANRLIQKKEDERKAAEELAKKKAEEEAAAKAEAERKAKEEAEKNEEGMKKIFESEWAKGIKTENEKLAKQLEEQKAAFASMMAELNTVKADRIKAQRETKLNEILEGTGVFGARIKKNYAKMNFETDSDFEDFVSGVEEDIKAFNQERADKGLDKLGVPAAGGTAEPGKVDPMTDAEVDALASIM